MELWIRSQDRRVLARAGMINIASDERTIVDDMPRFHYLGTYKTKERALEVLDEITDFIDGLNKTNTITIFQMPQE